MDAPNTVLLRLEGPLQAWGDTSKFVVRRTMEAPTKSGVLGMICCAMGLSRQATRHRLMQLNVLRMGVRIDRAGTRWWDYHTVGAKIGIVRASGGVKANQNTKGPETLVSRREYLCDASFLVALQGNADLVGSVIEALEQPVWPVFLGRKSCPPTRPVLESQGDYADIVSALQSLPWQPRLPSGRVGRPGLTVPSLIEWRAAHERDLAPAEAEVWYDVPVSFDPPVHQPRLVVRKSVQVAIGKPIQRLAPRPPRPRADYQNSEYKERRKERLAADHHLCVFCKAPIRGRGATVQHVTYRRAGGGEATEDLRSLCRLCHDAVTMVEYGMGMGLDRINPEDSRWRERIIAKRKEIIRFRSLETRRRYLSAEEVE